VIGSEQWRSRGGGERGLGEEEGKRKNDEEEKRET
jgi:hypothetical protein